MSATSSNAHAFSIGAPIVGSSSAFVSDELRCVQTVAGWRWVDPGGAFGYWPFFGGGFVCYTCGHLCECGGDDE